MMPSEQPAVPARRPITEVDRGKVRDAMTHFITKIERQRGQQPEDARIRKSVMDWEEKCFRVCNGSREMYVEKYNQKKQMLEAELKKTAAAQAAAAAANGAVAPAAAAPQQQRPAPPPQQVRSAAAAAAAAPAPKPASALPQPAQRAHIPQQQVRGAPTTTTSAGSDAQGAATTTPQYAALTKEFLENVREPLDQCRTILRILSTIFHEKSDGALKQEFVEVFQKTTDLLKKKLPLTDLQRQSIIVTEEVSKLRTKLEPRMQRVCEYLKLNFAEMVEMESQPFGLLQRTVEIHGTQRFAFKAKRISGIIGGRACLKIGKFEE